MLGFNYGGNFDEGAFDKVIQNIKTRDMTDNLGNKLKQFEIMKLSKEKRLEELERYMLNCGKQLSAVDLETFASGFNSKYLPLEVKREYYDRYFSLLADALRNNTNQYSMVG